MNFNFGRKPTAIIQYAVIGVVLISVVGTLSKCTRIPQDIIYKAIDSIQRRIAPGSRLNDYFIRDPHLLNLRVKGDIDNAIKNYEDLESSSYTPRMKNQNILKELKNPKYTWQQKLIVEDAVYYEFAPDTSKAQESLGPTMGIRGAWISPDPREIKD
jgi:hypothetical protein